VCPQAACGCVAVDGGEAHLPRRRCLRHAPSDLRADQLGQFGDLLIELRFGLTSLALDPALGSPELWPVAVAIESVRPSRRASAKRSGTRRAASRDTTWTLRSLIASSSAREWNTVMCPLVIGRICPIAAGGEPAADRHAFARRKGRRCDPATVELGTRTAAGPEFDRGGGLPLSQTTARSASTHAGSNCRPASVRISSRAASRVRGSRYGRGSIIAWKQSATATIRAASGISSARFPSG
jgi:hypothetical protein